MNNKERLEVLERVKVRYLQHFTYKAIAKELNDLGYKSERGGTWSGGGINRFLQRNDLKWFEQNRRKIKHKRPGTKKTGPEQLEIREPKEIDQTIPEIASKSNDVNRLIIIENCPACSNNHYDLELFRDETKPSHAPSLFFICPENKKNVFVQFDDNYFKKLPKDFPQPMPKIIEPTKQPEQSFLNLATEAKKTGESFIKIAVMLEHLNKLEKQQELIIKEIKALIPDIPVKRFELKPVQKTTRAKIRERIDNYCFASGANHKDIYIAVYRQFKYLHNKKLLPVGGDYDSGLDYAEQTGLIDDLWKVVQMIIPGTGKGYKTGGIN